MSTEPSTFLVKKLTAMAALILGFLVLLLGYWNESRGTIVIGWVLLALGAAILILKIVRRNNPNP